MKILGLVPRAAMNALLCLIALAAAAADYPAPNEGDWIARDFRFHTGDVMPELRLHYTTVGAPSGQPVLILHGTTGSGTTMLSPAFAGELFGPGQPLDASNLYGRHCRGGTRYPRRIGRVGRARKRRSYCDGECRQQPGPVGHGRLRPRLAPRAARRMPPQLIAN